MRAVGNIVTGDDTQTQLILNCGALPCIYTLLTSEKESIRKEASWTVSNITAGNRQQIQAVIDANIFPVLINILKVSEFKTRKEAAWAITNATSSGTAEQIKYLVSGFRIEFGHFHRNELRSFLRKISARTINFELGNRFLKCILKKFRRHPDNELSASTNLNFS